jgi:carboxyl-terminal processing protease
MNEILNHAAERLFPVLLDSALKGVVLLSVAGVLATVLHRQAASTRHLLWSLAIGGCLALPFLSMALPEWSIPLRVSWLEDSAPVALHEPLPPTSGLAQLPRALASPNAAANPSRGAAAPVHDSATAPIPTITITPMRATGLKPIVSAQARMVLIWGIGIGLTICPILLGLASLRRLRRTCVYLRDGFLTALVGLLADRLRIRRPIVLLASARRTIPMTWGVRRPVVLLPLDALNWSPRCLRAVLLHELAHIRRGDCLVQFLANACRAIFWFNPLMWLAVRQLRMEQERACDDLVLNSGPSAPDYAEYLLAVTAGLPVSRIAAPVALAMGRPRRIEQRLRTILDPHRDRRPLQRHVIASLIVAIAAFLGPLAAVDFQLSAADAHHTPFSDMAECPSDAILDDASVAEVRSLILKSYVRAVPEQDLSEGAIKGMLAALNDPYSEYLTAERVAELGRGTQGTFAGVGVQIHMKDNQITVVTPIDGSPALKAGVQPGDAILAIDGQPTKGLDLQTAVRRILGPKESEVKLRLRHPDGEETDLTLKRAQIRVQSINGFRRGADDRWEYFLDDKNKIAYVAITSFTASTADDLRALLEGFKEQNVKGLVIDLRFSPGGMLSSAVKVAEMFLGKGDVVAVKGHNETGSTYKADGNAILPEIPIVVLVNEQTASSAEVVAGALQESKRAVLLGTRTYGKGAIQNILEISGKGMLRLTTAHFYLPSGRSIQKVAGQKDWGVDPTNGYCVPIDAKQTEMLLKQARELNAVGSKRKPAKLPEITSQLIADQYADPQLAAALETLQAKLTKGEFVQVGKPNAVMFERLAKREDLLKKRDTLKKELEQVNRDLGEPRDSGR